jgi:AraC-like DNA-binding protein
MPATYLKVFLRFAAGTGVPLQPLLAGTALELEALRQSDHPVRFSDMRRVLANIDRVMPAGWHLDLDHLLTIAAHGALGFAVVTAPDLRTAVNVLLRYFGIRGPFLWTTGVVEDDQFVIRFFESMDMGAQRGILIELAILSVQIMLERSAGRELPQARLALGHPAPGYRERLEQSLHASLSYGAPGYSLRFPNGWLDEHCALYDEAMHRYLLSRCEEEMRSAPGSLTAEVAVRQAMLSRPGVFPGLADIAEELHISPRTLIRRLKRNGTSYQAILDEVRKTLASNYLLHSAMSVKQIAYRLGYQDASNFGRAFRGWFGVAPGRYRLAASGRD